MTRFKLLFAALALTAAIAVVPMANAAPTVHFLGAGSSAMFTGFEVAAVNDLAPLIGGGASIHHYTIKGSCSGGTCAQLHDQRSVSIPNESATMWVVWTCSSGSCTGSDATDVWAYFQVDSTVGVRTFLSRPLGCAAPCDQTAVIALVDAGTKTTNNGQDLTNALLLNSGVSSGSTASACTSHPTTCDDLTLPSDVWTAISGTLGKSLIAGLTDIRPEDAKYATKRLNKPLDTVKWAGLGYSTAGSAFVGSKILSGVDGGATFATPVTFGLPGATDPITGVGVPSTITTIPIGEAPIVFVVNRSNTAGLGSGINTANPSASTPYYTGLLDYAPLGVTSIPTAYPLGKLEKGKDCEGNASAFGTTGSNVLPPGGGTVNITFTVVPGAGGAGTVDYKYTLSGGAALSVGQKISIIGFPTGSANNGTFTITALPTSTKFEVSNPSGTAQTASALGLTNNFPIHVYIREGLSGTMNTAEWTEFREYGSTIGSYSGAAAPSNSQEQNIFPANGSPDNPLTFKPCILSYGPAGDKTRAIGTGQEVSAVKGKSDSIGYAFFSFGNVAPLATATVCLPPGAGDPLNCNSGTGTLVSTASEYGYLTLDSFDPIFATYGGSDPAQLGAPGQLPACQFGSSGTLPGTGNSYLSAVTIPKCAKSTVWTSGNFFPRVLSGEYRSWSLLRGLCDANDYVATSISSPAIERCRNLADDPNHACSVSGSNGTCQGDDLALEALIAHTQTDIDNDTGVPDFVPFADVAFYRSHFLAGNNYGAPTGPAGSNVPEAGGDAGGCILPVPPTNGTVPSGPFSGRSALECHQ